MAKKQTIQDIAKQHKEELEKKGMWSREGQAMKNVKNSITSVLNTATSATSESQYNKMVETGMADIIDRAKRYGISLGSEKKDIYDSSGAIVGKESTQDYLKRLRDEDDFNYNSGENKVYAPVNTKSVGDFRSQSFTGQKTTPTPVKTNRPELNEFQSYMTTTDEKQVGALVKMIENAKTPEEKAMFRERLSALRNTINERKTNAILARSDKVSAGTNAKATIEQAQSDISSLEQGEDESELDFMKRQLEAYQNLFNAQKNGVSDVSAEAQNEATYGESNVPTAPAMEEVPTEEELTQEFFSSESGQAQREKDQALENEKALQQEIQDFQQQQQEAQAKEFYDRQAQSASALMGSPTGMAMNFNLGAGIQAKGMQYVQELERANQLNLRGLILNQEQVMIQLDAEHQAELSNYITTRQSQVMQENEQRWTRYKDVTTMERQKEMDQLAIQNQQFQQMKDLFGMDLASKAEERANLEFQSAQYQRELTNTLAEFNLPFDMFQRAMETTGINEASTAYLTQAFSNMGMQLPEGFFTAKTPENFSDLLSMAKDLVSLPPNVAQALVKVKMQEMGVRDNAAITEFMNALAAQGGTIYDGAYSYSGYSDLPGGTGNQANYSVEIPTNLITRNVGGDYTVIDAKSGRTQCGESTNDILGLQGADRMGDTLASKIDGADYRSIKEGMKPIAGGYFVMDKRGITINNTGDYTLDTTGHVGLVTKVEDGGIWVTDWNYNGDEKRSDRFIAFGDEQWNKIHGFGVGNKINTVGGTGGTGGEQKTGNAIIDNIIANTPSGDFEAFEKKMKAAQILPETKWGGRNEAYYSAQSMFANKAVGGATSDEVFFFVDRIGLGTEGERTEAASRIQKYINEHPEATLPEAKKALQIITTEDEERRKRIGDDLKLKKKDFAEVGQKATQLDKLLQDAESGVGDYAAITTFLKSIDPTSVARESEVEAAEQARSLKDNALVWLAKMESGEKLSDTQRRQFKEVAKVLKELSDAAILEEMIRGKAELDDYGIPATVISEYEMKKYTKSLPASTVMGIYGYYGLTPPDDVEKRYEEEEAKKEAGGNIFGGTYFNF